VDRDRFNTLLEDMDKITDQDIKSLNQLRKQYPYFQNQYVMIARALKKRNHPKTDAFIKKAAIYSADRALLKSIIMDEYDFAPVVEEVPAAPVPQEVKEVAAPEPEASANTKEVVQEAPIEKTRAEAPSISEEQEKPELPKADLDSKQEEPSTESKPEAEQVQNAPEAEIKESPATPPTPLPEPEKAAPTVAETAREAAEVTTQENEAAPKPESNQELIDELERDLQEIRKKKQLIAKMLEQQEAKQASKKTTPAKKAAPAKKKVTTPGKSQSELIEKFIRNEPQMGKQKPVLDESNHQNEDLSARFTKEQDDFYTETMAKLMVTQKKYRKAIQVYEKLGLKFPEKRAYFASQIEQVKSRK